VANDDFRLLLNRLIAERFPSRRAFLRAAWSDDDGRDSASSWLSKILAGRCAVPLDRLPAWADALGLNGEERERFILAGQLSACPPTIAAEFLRMRAQLQMLNQTSPRRRAAEPQADYDPPTTAR
jgi:hypothetical protein